ncbi:MAG: 50S ribosomal protein L23 [Bacteroidota bacterium]|jgi:large subunit ribosomal protein L23
MTKLKPIVTEKSTRLQEENGHYVFRVDLKANKTQIKKAVEAYYPGVKVDKVRTMIMPSKKRGQYTRSGYLEGRTDVWKKAIISLREGEIDFFEEI